MALWLHVTSTKRCLLIPCLRLPLTNSLERAYNAILIQISVRASDLVYEIRCTSTSSKFSNTNLSDYLSSITHVNVIITVCLKNQCQIYEALWKEIWMAIQVLISAQMILTMLLLMVWHSGGSFCKYAYLYYHIRQLNTSDLFWLSYYLYYIGYQNYCLLSPRSHTQSPLYLRISIVFRQIHPKTETP